MSAKSSPLDAMVAQAQSLYSLPAVAMEVLRLTENQRVDSQTLKQCIERDPALAAKVLRVVNSSLFGLSGKVENLTQAIALLGIKPLKLLVLGFSLPSELLDNLDREQLQRYWRGSLTRAVAARQLMTSQWKAPGDDVFLVALLQDIGLLVLLQQLGTPYAKFLTQAREEQQDLLDLERDSLGFDHRQLTVEVLRNWNLPSAYTNAYQQPIAKRNTSTQPESLEATAQVLQLANLLAELVDEHRLSVLPELLAQGERFVGLTKDALSTLVAELDPQVEQLADVLQVDLGETASYESVLTDAHNHLSLLAEQAAAELAAQDDMLCEEVLSEAQELQQALRNFTRKSLQANPNNDARADEPQTSTPQPKTRENHKAANTTLSPTLLSSVASAVAECRDRRESLCVLQVELSGDANSDAKPSLDTIKVLKQIAIDTAADHGFDTSQVVADCSGGIAVLLPDFERRKAVALAKQVCDDFNSQRGSSDLGQSGETVNGGVAYLAVVPKAFDAQRLLSAMHGCLSSAHSSGNGAVKSIEVY